MQWSQIIGLGGLVLLAALGLWLMSPAKKEKPRGENRGEGPDQDPHGIVTETYRHSGGSPPGSD